MSTWNGSVKDLIQICYNSDYYELINALIIHSYNQTIRNTGN